MEFQPPQRLSLQGNVAENWRIFRQRFELFLTAKEAHKKHDEVKIAMLLTTMGPEALDRYNHLEFKEGEDPSKYETVISKLEAHFKGMKRVVYSRYQFWTHKRSEAQPFEVYLTTLQNLAQVCEFQECENMIRDKIVFSVQEKTLKERLLREEDLTLAKTKDICLAFEVTQTEVKSMAHADAPTNETKDINMLVNNKNQPKKPTAKEHPKQKFTPHFSSQQHHNKCSRCGTVHIPRNCPAYGQRCHKCNRLNHFASVCIARSVNLLEREQSQPSDEEFFLGSVAKCLNVETSTDDIKAWFVTVNVCQSTVKMKIDTGAETNVIPMQTWKRIWGKPVLAESNTKLKALGETFLEHSGRADVQFRVGDKTVTGEVFVTKDKTTPILGLSTSAALGLVTQGENFPQRQVGEVDTQIETTPTTLQSIATEYSDIFTGLGMYPEKYTIRLKDDAQPVIQPPRRVPQSLHKSLKKKLDDMTQKKVIEPVDQPTDWVNNLVIAEKKDGSLRLCLDPKQLNENIRREHFQIPTFEEVTTQLGGKRFFTILDQKDSYWQVQLDEESAKLCTFGTPFGRYKFLRMPFGIASASEVLQRMAYKSFGDIDNVHVIYDDMLIAATTEEEHDRTLKKVLERARQQNVKFNMKKTQFKKDEVLYLGMKISAQGVRPDEAKIKAITDYPEPTDKDAVRRLVGMVNFLSPFIPNKSSIISPLCNLLKDQVPFHWMSEHKEALNKIKQVLSSQPLLRLYDPQLPITIQADASSTGLGATLMQNNQPVAYASRSLTDTETRYAQIEKELLAIVFATEKFHHFTYGRQVNVQSDHKPLEMIIKKPLHKASPRLQSMLLRLLKYHLKITYTPGSKMHIADALSRAYLSTSTEQQSQPGLQIHSATKYIPGTPEKIDEIREACNTDPVLAKLKEYVCNGWPKHKGNIPLSLYSYWPVKDSIHEEDGLMFVENKVIIPAQCRSAILIKLHEGHLGMDKCKARARETIYWPNMNRDIDEHISQCSTCATYRPKNTKEPLIPHEVPERPWSKLGMDIFTFGGHDYLLVVDYFSKYPEVSILKNKTANGIIDVLKPMFARHGVPDTVVADNMPFASYNLTDFAKSWGFSIITSSPRYPQSNGQSEKFVGIVKSLIRKAYHEEKDPHIALLQYRNTPITGLRYSPAQLLMSRRLKDTLPTTTSLLKPTVIESAKHDLVLRQGKQKVQYDKSAKVRSEHAVGDNVRVLLGKTWNPAVVVGRHTAPRSYIVTTEQGNTYRRNSRMINKSPDQVHIAPQIPFDTPVKSNEPTKEANESRNTQPTTDQPILCRPTRHRKPPAWHKDYEVN